MQQSKNSKPQLDPTLQFRWPLLGPRYWPTWLILLLLRLVMFMPRRWVMSMGGWLGDRFRQKNKKRRRIVEVNLQLCFPDRSDAQRQQLCIDHFRAYGRGLLDMGLALYGSRNRILRLVDVEGLERHRQLLQQEKVMVVAWHLTTMEIGSNILGMVGPTVSMMKPMDNALLTWQVARSRRRMNDIELVTRDQGMRPLLRGLREGRQCLLFPDEDFGDDGQGTVFVPFFGVQRAMVTTPGRLARSAGARVVTCVTRLDPVSGRYRCVFSAPLEDTGENDPAAVAKAISRSMEQMLADAPEQYMWTFRWFRSRPDGAASPYDPVPQR